MKICLLISGNLGFTVLKFLMNKYSVLSVFTDAGSVEIIEHCKCHNIPLFVGNPKGGKSVEFRANIQCDVLLSVNYLFIIEDELIKYPSMYAINFHGSLLPKYRGRTPHVWAIINGENKTGITAHLITDDLDAGDIVFQKEIPISTQDTGHNILQKYVRDYPLIIERVLCYVEADSIKCQPQEHKNATYFSKRTPGDGEINWDWQRERIFNWVRALAPPYPGAFTGGAGFKLVVKSSILSDMGFKDTDKNGKILQILNNQITVKAPNGAITIFIEDSEATIQLKTGDILQ